MNFKQEFFNRLNSESPKFFKKAERIGVYLISAGFGLVSIPSAFVALLPDSNIDLSVFGIIAGYIVLTGMVIKLMAGLAVKDPDYSTLDKKKV